MIWPCRILRGSVAAAVLTMSACSIAPADAPTPTAAPSPEITVTRVVDGDTVEITSPDGAETKIRIIGIDSPETKKPGAPVGCWGPESSRFATEALRDRIVVVVPDPTQDAVDRWGRTLAYVEIRSGSYAGWDFSELAAETGNARSYVYNPAHPPRRIAAIQAAERRAVQARRGVWSEACLTRPTR